MILVQSSFTGTCHLNLCHSHFSTLRKRSTSLRDSLLAVAGLLSAFWAWKRFQTGQRDLERAVWSSDTDRRLARRTISGSLRSLLFLASWCSLTALSSQ